MTAPTHANPQPSPARTSQPEARRPTAATKADSAEAKVAPRAEAKADAKAAPPTETKADAKAAPPAETKAETKAAPPTEAKAETKAAPPAETKAAARSALVDGPPLPLPAHDALPTGDPDAPAPPPGPATEADTRSLRGSDQEGAATFAVVYRRGTVVVTGRGRVGCRGCWHAISYPSASSAGNAYARISSGLLAEGYTDVA
ncbi:MAG TPA: hypothetical protein VHE35_20600 [Kofleriaceae bacterium]|nr:hypothetical protein [Kofleriaceae bacterium]